MDEINFEVDKNSGQNLFKRKIDSYGYRFDLLLSSNTLPLTNYDLNLLKRKGIWIGDTSATISSTFYGAYGIKTHTSTISTTDVPGGSTKPSLQMDLDCIAWYKSGNTACLVQLGNVVLLKSKNCNLFSLLKLLNIGWQMHGNTLNIVMTHGSKVLTLDIFINRNHAIDAYIC